MNESCIDTTSNKIYEIYDSCLILESYKTYDFVS